MFISFSKELINLTTIVRISIEACESFEEHTITMENANFQFTESYKSEVDANFRYNQICDKIDDWELMIR